MGVQLVTAGEPQWQRRSAREHHDRMVAEATPAVPLTPEQALEAEVQQRWAARLQHDYYTNDTMDSVSSNSSSNSSCRGLTSTSSTCMRAGNALGAQPLLQDLIIGASMCLCVWERLAAVAGWQPEIAVRHAAAGLQRPAYSGRPTAALLQRQLAVPEPTIAQLTAGTASTASVVCRMASLHP